MVQDRKSVPKDSVCYTIDSDSFPDRNLRIATDASCDEVVTAVKAVCINLALTCFHKVPYPCMDSIELSLPVKGTAFEYDCYLHMPD